MIGMDGRSGDVCSGGLDSTRRLPSIFELTAPAKMLARVAVAESVVDSGDPQDFQSWDLILLGDHLQLLTCDPFSFTGNFLFEGLNTLVGCLLQPADFVYLLGWVGREDKKEYHARICPRV